MEFLPQKMKNGLRTSQKSPLKATPLNSSVSKLRHTPVNAKANIRMSPAATMSSSRSATELRLLLDEEIKKRYGSEKTISNTLGKKQLEDEVNFPGRAATPPPQPVETEEVINLVGSPAKTISDSPDTIADSDDAECHKPIITDEEASEEQGHDWQCDNCISKPIAKVTEACTSTLVVTADEPMPFVTSSVTSIKSKSSATSSRSSSSSNSSSPYHKLEQVQTTPAVVSIKSSAKGHRDERVL
ncbi:Integrator complex subunit 12 [Eumeta japonica]|uniref:Integrator complex subunit 12 n=1 Tax=Eumeta variegata TaxID=151549 RepID=A0A4C1SGT3_EUMVA|nr:Integrator complex subunit 12 [Eumeta japonica]